MMTCLSAVSEVGASAYASDRADLPPRAPPQNDTLLVTSGAGQALQLTPPTPMMPPVRGRLTDLNSDKRKQQVVMLAVCLMGVGAAACFGVGLGFDVMSEQPEAWQLSLMGAGCLLGLCSYVGHSTAQRARAEMHQPTSPQADGTTHPQAYRVVTATEPSRFWISPLG